MASKILRELKRRKVVRLAIAYAAAAYGEAGRELPTPAA
jgi:hypothetical protein